MSGSFRTQLADVGISAAVPAVSGAFSTVVSRGGCRGSVCDIMAAQFRTAACLRAEMGEHLIRVLLIRKSDQIALRGHDPVPAGIPVAVAVFRTDPSGIAAGGGASGFAVRTISAGCDRAAESDAVSGVKGGRVFSRADDPPENLLYITIFPGPVCIWAYPGSDDFNLHVLFANCLRGVLRRGKDCAGRGSVSRRAEHQRRETRADNTGKCQQMFFHMLQPFLKSSVFEIVIINYIMKKRKIKPGENCTFPQRRRTRLTR